MLKDRVKVNTITEGTGTLSIGSAYNGFNSFDALGEGINKTYYTVVNNSEWETGAGSYNSSLKTLTRETVFESSNSHDRINLSGQSIVFISYPARTAVFLEENQVPSSGNTLFFNNHGFVAKSLTSTDITNSLGYIPANPSGVIQTGNGFLDGTIQHNLSTTEPTVVDISIANGIKYFIKAECNSEIHIMECLAVRKANSVYNTVYGTLYTSENPLVVVTTTSLQNDIVLVLTALSSNTVIKLFKTTIS